MPDEAKKPETTQTPKSSGDNDVLMGVLSYLGILCLIPLLAAKDSEFAQFHAKQGLTLFAVEVVLWVVNFVLGMIFLASVGYGGFGFYSIISMLMWVVYLGVLVLAIIGIVNAVGKKKVPLPIIGGIHLMK